MGLFSRFEDKAGDVIEGSAGSGKGGGIEPVKLAKRAYKEMQREKMVGVGHQYAPTLYNVLVSSVDDQHMNGYYPTLAGEIETYLTGRAGQDGLVFDCPPLIRFIVDEGLKRGHFDVIAENVSPQVIEQLRHEEMEYYGIEDSQPAAPEPVAAAVPPQQRAFDPFAPSDLQSAPYVPNRSSSAAMPVVPPQPQAAAPANTASQQMPDKTVMLGSMGSANAARAALIEYETDTRHPLLANRILVGRETSCDIIIGDPSVSRRHAEVIHEAQGWMIRDLGSTNGLSVNNIRTPQSQIFDGDFIDLGSVRLQFREA